MESDNVEGGQILPRDHSAADVCSRTPRCGVANDVDVDDAASVGTDEQGLETIPKTRLSKTHGIHALPTTPVHESNCDVSFLTIDSEALESLRSYDSASPSPAKVTPKSRPRRRAARGRTRAGIQTRAARNLASKTRSCESYAAVEVQGSETGVTVHVSNEIVAVEDLECKELVVSSKDSPTRNGDVDAVCRSLHSNTDVAAIMPTLPDMNPETCRTVSAPLRHSVLSKKSWQAKIQNGHWTMVNERKEKRKYLGVPNKCPSPANAAFLKVAPPARETAQWQCLPQNGLTLPLSWHRQEIGDDSVGTFSAKQVTAIGSYPVIGKNSARCTNSLAGAHKVNELPHICYPLKTVGDKHETPLFSDGVVPGMDSDVHPLPLETSDVERTLTKVAKNTTVTHSLTTAISSVVETTTVLGGTSAKSKMVPAVDGTGAKCMLPPIVDGISAKSKVTSTMDGIGGNTNVTTAVAGIGTQCTVVSTLDRTSTKSKVAPTIDSISTKSKAESTIDSISAKCKVVVIKQSETKIDTIETSRKKNNNISQVACHSPDASTHVRALNFDVATPRQKTTSSDRTGKPSTLCIPKTKISPRVLDCLSPEQREAIHKLSNGTSSNARVDYVAVNATSSHERFSSTSTVVNSCNKRSTNPHQETRSFRSVTSKTCFVSTTTGDSGQICDRRNDETSVQTTGSVMRQEGVPSATLPVRRTPRRVAMKTIKQGDEMLAERTLARNAAQAALFARNSCGARTNIKNVPKKKPAAKCGAAPCSVVTNGTASESEVAEALVAFATSVVISPAKDVARDDCVLTNASSPKSTPCDSDRRTDGVVRAEAPKCSTPHGHPPPLASTASPVSVTRKSSVTVVRRTLSPDGVSQGMIPPCATAGRGKRKLESQQSVKVRSTCLYTFQCCVSVII